MENSTESRAEEKQVSAYDFEFNSLTSKEKIRLSDFKGKVILVVNTASHCGFTKQYSALQELYKKYQDRGFVIIGVPSNDFGAQEPGNSQEIAHFCKYNFGVEFPMTAKEKVSGKESHPFYKWANQKLGYMASPKWNFHKYLIDKNGNLIDYFSSITEPNSPKIKNAVEKALQNK